MTTTYYKYPKTPHLPWSPGITKDDICWHKIPLQQQEVVATEKLDGENTTMYRNHIHARSLDSRHHPSRNWVKRLHGQIAHLTPERWRLCGENMYAQHSLSYHNLRSYFYLFSVWDEHNQCLSWDETLQWAKRLSLVVPPVLYRGMWDEQKLRSLSIDTRQCEGYVVRTVAGFCYDEFSCHVAKWVREGHVQTEQHWMHGRVIPNQLRGK